MPSISQCLLQTEWELFAWSGSGTSRYLEWFCYLLNKAAVPVYHIYIKSLKANNRFDLDASFATQKLYTRNPWNYMIVIFRCAPFTQIWSGIKAEKAQLNPKEVALKQLWKTKQWVKSGSLHTLTVYLTLILLLNTLVVQIQQSVGCVCARV